MSRLLLVTWVCALLVAGCGNGEEPTCEDAGEAPLVNSCDGDVLVEGRVVRVTGQHSFDDSVALGPSSVASIALYSNPALGGDGESTLVAERRIQPAPELPFDFRIVGSLPSDAASSVKYHVVARVRQDGAVDELKIHDLLSETLTIVSPPDRAVVVEVSGLEACDAPNAGGFCASAE